MGTRGALIVTIFSAAFPISFIGHSKMYPEDVYAINSA
jgi:hypothetical protein